MSIRLKILPCSPQIRRTIGTSDTKQGAPVRKNKPEDKALPVGSTHVVHGDHLLCCRTEKSEAEAREIR
jgi:hypothetical protein